MCKCAAELLGILLANLCYSRILAHMLIFNTILGSAAAAFVANGDKKDLVDSFYSLNHNWAMSGAYVIDTEVVRRKFLPGCM